VHGLRTGGNGIKGLVMQWQKGKEVTVWPSNLANGQMTFPTFVKLPN
jgi:branched-chain amino acid transport system substrate-binding protein